MKLSWLAGVWVVFAALNAAVGLVLLADVEFSVVGVILLAGLTALLTALCLLLARMLTRRGRRDAISKETPSADS